MTNDLNLKNIDDLIYMEGALLSNISEEDIVEINTFYTKKIKTTEKQIKNDKSLFLYDYRPSTIDFNNPNWRSEEIIIENPAIQPHDSKIESINLKENMINIKGSGNSYMDYKEYNFALNFNGLDNFSILESGYSNFKKESVKKISFEDFNVKLSTLNFRDVFLDISEKLKKEINFVFIDNSDEDEDKEKRNIIVIKFEYDNASVNCTLKKKKPSKKI